MKSAFPVLLLAVAACGSAPYGKQPAGRECVLLAEEIGANEGLRRSALQTQQHAWKAIVPAAVAGLHATGSSALANAERRLDALHAQAARRNCEPDRENSRRNS